MSKLEIALVVLAALLLLSWAVTCYLMCVLRGFVKHCYRCPFLFHDRLYMEQTKHDDKWGAWTKTQEGNPL